MAKYHTKNEVDNLMIEESTEDNTISLQLLI